MPHILVVDDHAANRELISTLLGYAGHSTSEAADGADALARVRAEQPALVICDILMPTMDGYEFVRQLRADPQIAHTEVVFCTATFMEKEARNLALSCGVSKLLFKPCEPQSILELVEATLGQGTQAPPLGDAEFDRDHLRLITDKLVAQTDELRHANQRLSALTEINLQLASERDPYVMLDQVCRGARALIGAKFSILAVKQKNGQESVHYCTSGLSAGVAAELGGKNMEEFVLGEVMRERTPRRFLNPGGDPSAVGLPEGYPNLACGLVAPIISLHNAYGWILLIDKLGADSFSDEDERILAIHSAQAGRIYENGSLYLAMKRNAEQLQIEVQERERAARELQIANETLELRVEKRTAELREMIEGLESFNRTVSHDLRGPLGGIAGVAKLARDFVASGDTAQAERMLTLISDRAATTEKLVNTLLALARASEFVLNALHVDTQALVSEVIQSLQPAGVSGTLPVTVGVLPPVDADAGLLRQVFVNLITNALKFASRAEKPHVEVGAMNESSRTVFFVRDNGVGFTSEQAQRLFKPFQRLHGASFDGFGLGLSIVKRILDRHGGDIWAEGKSGQGATFFFSLEPSPRGAGTF
jgi:signal transduction histidine kinase/CheY-like chemotaxis protein